MKGKGSFIDGDWVSVRSSDGQLTRHSPAEPDKLLFRGSWSRLAVDRAVAAAREALPAWDRLGVEQRKQRLQSFARVLEDHSDDIARAIAREAGKPLWEARGEAAVLVKKIDIMSDEGLAYTERTSPEGLNGHFEYRPHGVLSVLGPFNFPLHLPNGHIVPALLTGNTVVVKPSELTPGTMQLYFQCLAESDIPDGVVNLVQGPGEIGAELVGHPGVNGVLFTGSYETGMRIKRATIDHYWKTRALEMGGKNTAIVLEDADLEQAAYRIAEGAFLTTGQRCSATNRVVVRKEVAEQLIDRLASIADRVTVGHPIEDEPFMGPLIGEAAFDSFLTAQEDDEKGRLEPVRRGHEADVEWNGYFVTPGLWIAHEVDPQGTHQGAELFGPDVVIYSVESDPQAAHVANATEYGLAMSCFTSDRQRFRQLGYDLKTGILNLNRPTCGASSRLPFGGVKKSGNDRPSAVLAGRYCAYPQARLQEPAEWSPDNLEDGPLSYLQSE